MKLISWNVNGIRACVKKGFLDYIKKENPDIMCIQETKAHPEQVDEMLDNYHHYWNSAEKKGYAGTAIFTKEKPLNVYYGLNEKLTDEEDTEGRAITAEFKDFFVITVYVPNAKHGLLRLDYRLDWDKDLHKWIQKCQKKKPVILCGDLNVAHKEIDLKNPKTNTKNPGFTPEERESFSNLLNLGMLDTFRMFNQEPGNYSWWSYRFNARARNIGWRIDYVCVSEKIKKKVKEAFIRKEVLGSDHCPVGILL